MFTVVKPITHSENGPLESMLWKRESRGGEYRTPFENLTLRTFVSYFQGLDELKHCKATSNAHEETKFR